MQTEFNPQSYSTRQLKLFRKKARKKRKIPENALILKTLSAVIKEKQILYFVGSRKSFYERFMATVKSLKGRIQ